MGQRQQHRAVGFDRGFDPLRAHLRGEDLSVRGAVGTDVIGGFRGQVNPFARIEFLGAECVERVCRIETDSAWHERETRQPVGPRVPLPRPSWPTHVGYSQKIQQTVRRRIGLLRQPDSHTRRARQVEGEETVQLRNALEQVVVQQQCPAWYQHRGLRRAEIKIVQLLLCRRSHHRASLGQGGSRLQFHHGASQQIRMNDRVHMPVREHQVAEYDQRERHRRQPARIRRPRPIPPDQARKKSGQTADGSEAAAPDRARGFAEGGAPLIESHQHQRERRQTGGERRCGGGCDPVMKPGANAIAGQQREHDRNRHDEFHRVSHDAYQGHDFSKPVVNQGM